jgi:hypothetical protein
MGLEATKNHWVEEWADSCSKVVTLISKHDDRRLAILEYVLGRSPQSVDHRYFYLDEESNNYACGFARNAAELLVCEKKPG